MYKKFLLIGIILVLLPTLLFAQAGKLRGFVTDKETGDPLPGANIILEGTQMGSAADLNGEFIVLGVPAGVYTIRADYIGYQSYTIANIRVSSNLTTNQDFSLASTALEMESVSITADRPIVQRNTTNTVRMTTQEDMKSLPIRGVGNIVGLNAGVVQQNGVTYVRGGRSGEVGYYIDGASANDPYSRGNFVSIIQEAVEEIQMQAGGYTAEYGGSNSGIVRTTFRSGGPKLRGSLDYRTDAFSAPGEEFLGTTSRQYHNVVATLGGPMPGLDKMKFFVAAQFNQTQNRSNIFIEPFKFDPLDDSLPEYSYEAWQDGQRDFYAPWWVEDGLSGRAENIGMPLTNSDGDTIPFEFKRNWLPKNASKNWSTNMTLTYPVSSAIKLRLTGSVAGSSTPSGNTGYNSFSGAVFNYYSNQPFASESMNSLFALRMTHLINPKTFYDIGVSWSNRHGRSYDPAFGDDWQKNVDAWAWGAAGRDTSGFQNRFVDPENYSAVFDFTLETPNTYYANYNKYTRNGLGLTLDLTSQVLSNLELKVGGRMESWKNRNWSISSYSYNNYIYGNDGALWEQGGRNFANNQGVLDGLWTEEYITAIELDKNAGIDRYGYDTFGENHDDSDGAYGPRKPFLASAYFQTKWEYRDLILNLGLRYETYDYNAYRPVDAELFPYDAANRWVDPDQLIFTDPYNYLLPRINFAFPVTDNTIFYAQYGKYVQSISMSAIYSSVQGLSNLIPENRNVLGTSVSYLQKPERNDQYELGIRQSLTQNFAFTVTAFYKNQYDLLGAGRIYATGENADEVGGQPKGARFDGAYINEDIAIAKGLEFTMELRRTQRLMARVNYTMSNTKGTASSRGVNNVVNSDAIEATFPTLIYNLDQNQPHRGSVLMDYRFGKGDGGKILEGMAANLLFTFNSGHNYTAVEEPKNLGQATPWNVGVRMTIDRRFRRPTEPVNTSLTPWNFNIDMTLEKTIYMNFMNIRLYTNVLNLLNTKNITRVYPQTGTDDDDGWLKHPLAKSYLAIPGYEAVYRTFNLVNGYNGANGATWTGPRQLRFGVSFEFN
jgi:hypothetical protein